jgi:uncharacterized protein
MFIKLIAVLLFPLIFLAGWYSKSYTFKENVISITDKPESASEPERPFLKYTIDNLSQVEIVPGNFEIVKEMKSDNEFVSYQFRYSFYPALDGNQKSISGQINKPFGVNKYPLILMLRGFVNQSIYQTGMGTKNASEYFVRNGFITIAPDFLGYAESDKESDNIFETRFQTYTSVLSLIKALPQIDEWDGKNVFIWAHSNGGQVTLTTLTVTGADYPATLWAPVTKPFPYSILYYTDASADKGKFIRSELAKLETLYNVEDFSFDNYIDRINAPLMLHQGTADTAVPTSWSNEIVNKLKRANKDVTYYTYPGSDHDLRPAWDTVIARDLEFFRKNIK